MRVERRGRREVFRGDSRGGDGRASSGSRRSSSSGDLEGGVVTFQRGSKVGDVPFLSVSRDLRVCLRYSLIFPFSALNR